MLAFKSPAYWVFCAILLAATSVSAEDFTVIESSTAAWIKGAAVNDSAVVSLSAGQSVVLLSKSGKILRLSGPFAGAPAGAGAAPSNRAMEALTDAVLGRDAGASSLGGVRGNMTAIAPDTTVPGTAIEVMRGGTWCLENGASPMMSRAPFKRSAVVIVDRLADDGGVVESSEAPWQAWSTLADWPSGVAIADQSAYRVAINGEAPAEFRLRIIPTDADQAANRLNWMAAAGCQTQVRTALDDFNRARAQ
jgi:hypothetical protein